MRVPGVPQPSVSLNPLPDVNYRSPQTGALGGLVQNLGQMSEASIQAANLRVSEQENKARLLQATIRNEAAQVKGAGVLPKEGQTFIDSHLQKWDENVSKLATELNGSYQQKLFKKRMDLLRTSLTADLDAHEKAETRVYADGVDEATVNLEAQNAGANIDSPKDLSIGQMRVYGAVESMAKRNGWGPEEAQEKRLKAIGGFHVSVLGAAVDRGKLDYAKSYLEQHGDEIAPEARGKIETAIAKRGVDVTSDKMANEIWASLGPKNDTDATNLDAMVKAIPESVSPEVRKQVRNGLKELASDRDYSVKQREDSLVSGFVKDIEGGKSWNSIKNNPAFGTLSGMKQDALHRMFEDKYEAKEGARDASLYNDLLKNPAILGMMSEDAIIALTPMIGKTYRDDLLSVKKRLSGKPATQNVLNDALNHFGQKQGYLVPRGDKLVPKDPSEWAEIQYKVNQRLANDKAESEADISNVVRSVMARATIKTPGRIWGTNAASKRISAMSNAELDAAVAVVSPKDLEVIYDALSRQGIYHPTKRQILEAQAALLMEE